MGKYIEHVYNAITGETEVIEREYTTEELAEQARQIKEQNKENIQKELAQLDTQVSRVEEDLIAFTKMPVHSSKQSIISRKQELRKKLQDGEV